MGARHRMSKLLLRHGFVYSDGAAWTDKHDRWVRSHRGGDLAFMTAFDASYEAVVQTVTRRDRLDKAIGLMAADSRFTPLVNRLGCLRGIGTLTGFALAVEITDWHRFTGNTIVAITAPVPGLCCTPAGIAHRSRRNCAARPGTSDSTGNGWRSRCGRNVP